MTNAKRCDRCESYYINDEKTYDGRSYNLSGTVFFNRLVLEKENSITGSYLLVDRIDLCPDCRRDLRMFILKGRADES